MKTARQLERHFKGASNHRRIEILLWVNENKGITVKKLAKDLEANFKTISQHTLSLVRSGLLNKHYEGRAVIHRLSPYGKRFVKFIKEFQKVS
ncbi:MAG: hypothetical protein COU11_02075 [Candidatus Harrisonbacteria bacterium CG10_big_fil_rev_8_21_14_0_10_49_15]|uniref:HTH arsR-type domain-containing protein n=1 Tax=Candidatus Harrisonbacteria bacterium CG10_big_fil_rev_8_21_14_0_10_49_15 TaxID=1974587 RepID=A0A2H0UMU3_9BACT|nr:MAG: hypothetical protein COU11_02075 [Candidatus Harrisonbacteria bacterium CG10_big_fil_rev_8_21_14_0_10_49_15]